MNKIKHNMSHSRLYRIWRNMKSRVNNPNCESYQNYGKRGIKVCEEWKTFIPFMEWALSNGYSDDLTIERINNNKGYNPENCKWITRTEQNRNIRGRGTSKYRGVFFEKERNKYQSALKVDGKKIHLGRYETEFQAALAYDLYCIENEIERGLNVLGVIV